MSGSRVKCKNAIGQSDRGLLNFNISKTKGGIKYNNFVRAASHLLKL